jgi:hypothetical protein
MEYFMYIDTHQLSHDTVKAMLLALDGFYPGISQHCSISAHDIEKTRERNRLLGMWFKGDALDSIQLFSWYDHAQLAHQAKLYKAEDVQSFFRYLSDDFKYFNMAKPKG